MKGILLAGLLAGAVAISVSPVMSTIYADAYPEDPIKRAALDHCWASDHQFNRLLAAERAACYERVMPVPPPAPPTAQADLPPVAVNFVDMRQEQGLGRLPGNDIRAQQRNARTLSRIRSTMP